MAANLLKRAEKQYGDRLPAGQKLTDAWPVLTYGSPPKIETVDWKFAVAGEVEHDLAFTWDEFNALGRASETSDVHCVTGWSKFDNEWTGVAFKDVLARIKPNPGATHVMVHSFGGYTTNLRLDDLLQPGVLFAHTHNGKPLAQEHGGPMRLVMPHLYFWKSAKWVRGLLFMNGDKPGFWEMYGYHMRGDPWQEERYS